MNIKHEDSKCVCCEKVHINSLLMDIRETKDEHFIICFACANNIHKFVKQMKESSDS